MKTKPRSANRSSWFRSARLATHRRPANRIAGRRPFHFEALEDRRLLAYGDLLFELEDPSSVAEGGATMGYQLAQDADYTVVTAPQATVNGVGQSGRAFVYSTATGALLYTLENPTPGVGDWFGSSVDLGGNRIVVGARYDDVGAIDSGAAYVFEAASGNLLQTLTNPSPAADDHFGSAVTVSSSRLVVAAVGHDESNAIGTGEVYSFNLNSGVLERTIRNPYLDQFPSLAPGHAFGADVDLEFNMLAVGSNVELAYLYDLGTTNGPLTLHPPDASNGYGTVIAISGTRVVVGEYQPTTGSGEAHLYDTGTGKLLHTLTSPGASDGAFGYYVALSGNTVAVGAPFDRVGSSVGGSPHIFDATSGSLLLSFNNPNPGVNDHMGFLATSGDTVVVGAPFDDAGFADSGSAYLLKKSSSGTWSWFTTLENPARRPSPQAHAGLSANASDGDLTVVGAPGEDVGGFGDVGRAYVYDHRTGALVATLNHPNPADAAADQFGGNVAISADLAVVSAVGDDVQANNGGAVYVFNARTGALVSTLRTPRSAEAGDAFGSSVAISGNHVIVGAPLQDYHSTIDYADSGFAYVYNATTGVLVRTQANPTPAAGDQFGNAVAIFGNSFAVGAHLDDTGATDRGAVYVFDLVAPTMISLVGGSAGEWFGYSIALADNSAADGSLPLVVGAPQYSGLIDRGGVAYVFNARDGLLRKTLINPAPSPVDEFGFSVDISGSRVVVGAEQDDAGATFAGSAYVFDLNTPHANGDPTKRIGPIRTFHNPIPQAVDYFGWHVSISNDLVMVGTPGSDFGATNAGVVWVYSVTEGTLWNRLTNPALASGDEFGTSVAVSDDYIIVGAHAEDEGPIVDAGAVYVYNAHTGALLKRIANPTPSAGDVFGRAVAISGNTIAVGAPLEDVTVSNGSIFANAGAVYLFDASSGGLIHHVANPFPGQDDQFGHAVAIDGNLVAIGAYADEPSGSPDAGAAFVYNITARTLRNLAKAPQPFERFGNSIAISGNRVLVGAFNADRGAIPDTGAAYLFNASTGVRIAEISSPTPDAGDRFGASVAILGLRLVIGAELDDTAGVDSGAVYVFEDVSASPATLLSPTPNVNDQFGHSVALGNGNIVVGAWRDNTGAADAGAAYLYGVDGVFHKQIANPTPATSELFGSSVSISNQNVVVGAPYVSGGTLTRGAVYVFETPSDPPVADAGGPYTFNEGSHVLLDGTSSTAGSSPITKYEWDLDYDGATFNIDVPSDKTNYGPSGDNFTRTIALRVTDSAGNTDIDTTTMQSVNVAPVVAIQGPTIAAEGTQIELTSTVSDPGAWDSWTYSWWVTRNGAPMITGSPTDSILLNIFDNDTYVATLTVTDDDGGVTIAEHIVQGTNVAPSPSFAGATTGQEGSAINVIAVIGEPVTSHDSVVYSWVITKDGVEYARRGGGGTSLASTGFGAPFIPDDNGAYEMTLTVTDDDGGVGTATRTIHVTNVAPMVGPLSWNAATIHEGQSVTVSGAFTDPALGAATETFTGTALWSDGISTPLNITGGMFTSSRLFADDNPSGTASDAFTVQVSISDDDGGSDSEISTAVTVTNVAPAIQNLTAITPINENSLTTLTGNIVDPGAQDTFTLSVDWGDGSPLESFNYVAGTTSFTETHRYLDQGGSNVPSNNYQVFASIVDDDAEPTASMLVTFHFQGRLSSTNEDFDAGDLFMGSFTFDPSVSGIDHPGSTLNLQYPSTIKRWDVRMPSEGYQFSGTGGSISVGNTTEFVGPFDRYIVTLAGAGNSNIPLPSGRTLGFLQFDIIDHDADLLADDSVQTIPPDLGRATASGGRFVFTDNEQPSLTLDQLIAPSRATTSVTVNNAPPTVEINGPRSAPEGSQIELTSSVTDPSPTDSWTYSWWVTRNGAPMITGSPTDSILLNIFDNDTYVATLTVTDDDGGVTIAEHIVQGTNVAPSPSFAGATTGQEGSAINVIAVIGEPVTSHDSVVYSWVITKDGIEYARRGGGGTSLASTGFGAPFIPDDNGAYEMTLTVTDDDGGVGAATSTIHVTNVAPTANAGGPYTVREGESLTLNASGTDPAGANDPLIFSWDLNGDDVFGEAAGENSTYTWSQLVGMGITNGPATHSIRVAVNDQDGGVTYSTPVALTVLNAPPTALITGVPTSTPEGVSLTLTSEVSDPSPTDTWSYAWHVTKNGAPFINGATTSDLTFTPNDNANWEVRLTVTDSDGAVSTDTRLINVLNVAPVARITAPDTATEGSIIDVRGFVDDVSFDHQAYTFTVSKNGAFYTQRSGGGTISGGSTGFGFPPFIPDDDGTYVITFTTTDDDGATDSAAHTVAVSNSAPTVSITDAPTTSPEGTSVALTAAANDPGALDTHTFAWQVMKDGSLYANGGATLNFIPDDNGEYLFTVTATDNNGGVGTDSRTIIVTNVYPVANAGGPYLIGEGDSLTLDASASFDVAGTSDPLLFAWDLNDDDVFGDATGVNPTLTWEYLNTYGIVNGPSSRPVTVVTLDGDGGVSYASVDLTVSNTPPTVAILGATATAPEGSTLDLTANVNDPGTNDTWTQSWHVTRNGVTIISGPADVVPLTITDNVEYVVTLTVTDNDGGVTVATETIQGINVVPAPSILGPTSGSEGSPTSLTGIFGEPTQSHDSVVYRFEVTKDGVPYAARTSSSSSGGGSSGYSFVPDDNGLYELTFTVTDDDGAVGIAQHTIQVNNVAPTATIAGPVNALAGQILTFTLTANDASPIDRNVTNGVPGSGQFTYHLDWDGDGAFDETASGENGLQVTHVYVTASGPSGYSPRVTATDKDGGTSATAALAPPVVVDAPDGESLQQILETSDQVTIEAHSNETVDNIVDAINDPAFQPSAPVEIVLDLGGQEITGVTLSPPPNATITIVNGTLEGASPALVVASGHVVLLDSAAANATDAPTILVTGGTLVVRNSIIEETTASSRAAIEITGGTVDLGTQADPGGNLLNIRGAGQFIRNTSGSALSAIGNAYHTDEVALTSNFRIEDKIHHALDAAGLGLVSYVAGNVFVTPASGSIQRGVDAIAIGGVVNVEGTSYPDYAVGPKPLTVSFTTGQRFVQVADPLAAGASSLFVTGATAAEHIHIDPGTTSGEVDAAMSDVPTGTFVPAGRIVIFAGAGDDNVQIASSIDLPVWLFGEAGDDRLKGGAGNNVLLGGDGDDLLVGGSGRDLLIGGAGADRIVGNADDDILIAAATAFDNNQSALSAIMAEWTSARDYATRTANIAGTGSGQSFDARQNANYFLTTQSAERTVMDDAVKDTITGSSGQDWFFVNLAGGVLDKVTDLHAEEFQPDLDFILSE